MNVSDELKHQLQSVIHELGIQIPPVVSSFLSLIFLYNLFVFFSKTRLVWGPGS